MLDTSVRSDNLFFDSKKNKSNLLVITRIEFCLFSTFENDISKGFRINQLE